MADGSLQSKDVETQFRIVQVAEEEKFDDDGNIVRDQELDESDAVMEDLNFIMFGDTDETDTADGIGIATIHGSKNCKKPECTDALMQIEATEHLESSKGPSLLFGQLKPDTSAARTRNMRLINLQVESAYHSSVGRAGNVLTFGTHYNLRENRDPEVRGQTVHLHYQWQSLRFLYNLKTGRATYLLSCSDEDFEYYSNALEHWKMPTGRRPHPFSIHLVLCFKSVFAWNKQLEDALGKLLYLENRSIFRPSRVTFESADDTKRRLQELHSLYKDLLIRNNTNKRHIEMINCLTQDLDRILTTVKSTEGAFPIDEHDHQRIIDGFKCLKDFCLDRERRLTSRAQRVQNLIALTYNLLANRDNIISHSIAHEARQDGAAMKTIALVTMLFFPATFVSSFLGTNLVTLDTSPDGKTRFVFSEFWWIYLVSAVPLTLVTLGGWGYWVRRRSRRERRKFRTSGGDKV
ncbi:MAG: hypothetical protein Q9179_004791 [Wetmoreana sp. 5 TL-2023]